MTILVFDIETVPDLELGRELYNLYDITDEEVHKALLFMHRQNAPQSKLLPLLLHKIVAISLVFRSKETFRIWSLGDLNSAENHLINRFFEGIDKYTPQLISWNGTNFDLPVLHYRALKYGISSSTYWDNGKTDPNFKWNNYLSRYHERHLDLMDLLSNYNARAFMPLHQVSKMLKLPGKSKIDGSDISDLYNMGDLQSIRNYCETDVLNTYLIYLHFELMRGNFQTNQFHEEIEFIQNQLISSTKEHLKNYASNWQISLKSFSKEQHHPTL